MIQPEQNLDIKHHRDYRLNGSYWPVLGLYILTKLEEELNEVLKLL